MSHYLMIRQEAEKLAFVHQKMATVEASAYSSSLNAAIPATIERGVANIEIAGVLEPERVAMYDYYGVKHTAYSDIRSQISQANEAGVKKIVFNVSSGGGNVEGMLPTMKAMASTGTKTVARVSGCAASAAYMLASQCDTVEASSELDILGSIGVVTSRLNIDFIKEITNSDSPNKRPDIGTEEGVAVIKEELDDIYNIIIPHVAKGRDTTVGKINSDWGKGATMTAKTAMSRGMIDKIKEEKAAGRSGSNKGKRKMTKEEFKAQHPDLYNAILEEGKIVGKSENMETAAAHIELASASGATERALADISAGNPVTTAVIGFHGAAGIKKMQIDARTAEAPAPLSDGPDLQAEALDNDKKDENAVVEEYAACGMEVEL